MITRRNTNLKDALISSKHPAVSGKEIQNYWEPCHIEKCNICNSIYKGTISNKHSKTETKLNSTQCRLQYHQCHILTRMLYIENIGETKRAFKHRLEAHLADIKYNRDQCQYTSTNRKE